MTMHLGMLQFGTRVGEGMNPDQADRMATATLQYLQQEHNAQAAQHYPENQDLLQVQLNS